MVNSMDVEVNTFSFALRILLKISMKGNNDMEMLKRINLDESECKKRKVTILEFVIGSWFTY